MPPRRARINREKRTERLGKTCAAIPDTTKKKVPLNSGTAQHNYSPAIMEHNTTGPSQGNAVKKKQSDHITCFNRTVCNQATYQSSSASDTELPSTESWM
ncbi:uncharacterized protein LOC144246462 [Lonchura striata]